MSANAKYINQQLFADISAGDEAAFTIFFKKYYPEMFWNAYKFLKSEFWAEEIVQGVFLSIWTQRANLKGVISPTDYLYRLVANRCLDRIRRHERESKAQYLLQQELLSESDATTEVNQKERLHQLLEEAVNHLPQQRRRIYQLRYKDGLSYHQIAEMLDLTKNTVRNHLTLAVSDIRSYILSQDDIYILICLIIFF
ncbi:RNA polymerase sigma-70 factor [Chitinophaga pendula]|uniref:RNA polymerase sigma factor n=1 Tax=Chitinophaga TaxID=79328 RepID=UPI0012FD722B|nr:MULTISPECIES: RNA polymerase sigma-70 factor [Chitinophaga]UCJ10165.1 RNA polymerase sigma-70 factor [Chitinophaga pendula]